MLVLLMKTFDKAMGNRPRANDYRLLDSDS